MKNNGFGSKTSDGFSIDALELKLDPKEEAKWNIIDAKLRSLGLGCDYILYNENNGDKLDSDEYIATQLILDGKDVPKDIEDRLIEKKEERHEEKRVKGNNYKTEHYR